MRRLLLSYLLAKAVWRFYDVDWITEDWTKDAVHFMRLDLDEISAKQHTLSLSHLPFILADLQTAKPASATFRPRMNIDALTHKMPKILSLGVVLLEIELGRPLEIPAADMTPTTFANHVHRKANQILSSTEWTNRSQVYSPLAEAIEICVKPDTSVLNLEAPEKLREHLYEHVVAPLDQFFSAGWIGKKPIRPETFPMRPIEFEDPSEPRTGE